MPQRFWSRLRIAGIVLAAVPVFLMLGTGLAASLASGRILMDVLLPAELGVLTLSGMLLMALAAWKQKTHPRFAVVLPLLAILSLVLCQGTALLSGIGTGKRAASGPLWWMILFFLIVYDLTAIAAPVAGVLAARAATRR